MDEWGRILARLRDGTSRESYENWLEPVRFGRIDDDRSLRLLAPNGDAKVWLETEFRSRILDAAGELNLDLRSVVVDVDGNGPAPVQQAFDFRTIDQRFSEKYNFDRFVVGSCNEFAHAAARAVADNPAKAYNPLYLYSGVGMGKTHLMHAIGRRIREAFPEMKVVYVSAEEFMNDMIDSIRYDRMRTFHERFRTADALLVDDIQTLGSRERTQEEFFHTFNVLHNSGKQIVISSDTAPNAIQGLFDRLKSRFAWGLMADIQPPDLETKMAILDRKADEAGTELPDNVRSFLATHLNSNIRELEGALIRLIATASLSKSRITLGMARQSLGAIVAGNERKATIANIQQIVAEDFQLQSAQLKERTNAKAISYPRQIAMYLCKKLTQASFPEIGRAFGGKHHTTVLHAVSKISRKRCGDEDLDNRINKLTSRFD